MSYACPQNGFSGWLDSTFAYLFVGPAEQKRQDQTDAQLQALNQQELDQGKITQAEFDRRTQEIANSSYQAIISNPETSVWSGFQQGAAEGLQKDLSLAQSAVSFKLLGMPAWIWLAGGAVLFIFKPWKR